MKHFILTSLIILMGILKGCKSVEAEQNYDDILPKPSTVLVNEGIFLLDSNAQIYSDDAFQTASDILAEFVSNGSNIAIGKTSEKDKANIIFLLDDSIENEEGYVLEIDPDKIAISAKTNKGAFYAVQTLRQLLPIGLENGSYKESEVAVACGKIVDEPKFSYRGMHLDVARHFYSMDELKKYIDYVAMLKFNKLHIHFTDDQGWRIEIKKYPKLTTVASVRKGTLIGHYNDEPQRFDETPYGGFYTQEDIKELIVYAEKRSITIIPEIEMPGHALAALSAYPEYGCVGEHYEPAMKWGIFEDIFCSKDETFVFLQNVLDEIIELFPSKYIHIGGDEAPKTRWEVCKACQNIIEREGLKDEHELQSYFVTKIEKYLNSKGRQMIGWDEILEGGLAPNATVMSWRGEEGAIQAAKQGHDVILTPNTYLYFDYYQHKPVEEEPLAIGGYLPLETVYEYNPVPEELSKEEAKYVLGGQANIWTEYMPDFKQVEYMFFPRAIALSEVLWTTGDKEYENFVTRLTDYETRLKALNINYFNKYKE